MKRFIKTKLFYVLSSTKKDSIDYIELSTAYDDFVSLLLSFCREEQDVVFLCFTINYTAAEIKGLDIQLKIEGSYSSPKLQSIVVKILDILDSTYRVVKFRFDNLDFFQSSKDDNFESDVYLAEDIDLIDIMEVICGLFYSHTFRNRIGNPVNFSDLTRIFEKGMNFQFSDIYKKRDDVFRRKATKITEFLNELIVAIKIESKNRGYL